ncbi:hypothetical protein THRCLA_06694 [Thraustotheca clavata]|uniref:Transmembrane protein n=1 Tax=Thraustotheca clavata TaxID=74557 RepID=A0A1V9ZKQ4_9STRA|nr:hypothetical protein THRCLA_06694 [Thraustotheca clavata]
MMLQTTKQLAKAVKAQAPVQARMLSYTDRQAKLGRPVSPHVEIYAFPVTAIASITNRATGVALTGGFASAAFLSLLGADVQALIFSAQEVIPFFAPLSKFCVAFPVTYHSLNAVRSAVWSKNPELLDIPHAAQSSTALLAAAGVVGVGAACYTIKRTVKPLEGEISAFLRLYDDRDTTMGSGIVLLNEQYDVHRFHPPLIYGRRGDPAKEEGEGIALCKADKKYCMITYVFPTLSARAVPQLQAFCAQYCK